MVKPKADSKSQPVAAGEWIDPFAQKHLEELRDALRACKKEDHFDEFVGELREGVQPLLPWRDNAAHPALRPRRKRLSDVAKLARDLAGAIDMVK